jgi:hypothetical protein
MKFKYTKVAGSRYMSLTRERVPGMLHAIQRRPSWEGVIITPDAKLGLDGKGQYPVLSLGWYPDFGFSVHFMGLDWKENHFAATQADLSKPEVYVELGGQGQELWPRELFVPYALAERAVNHLLRAGKRNPSLTWVGISAFKRRAVKPREVPSASSSALRSAA